jgi:hypothetical protein
MMSGFLSCVTQSVSDDKQQGSGSDNHGGDAQGEYGEAYESFDADSDYISHDAGGFLSVFDLCPTLRSVGNHSLGVEGYELHRRRDCQKEQGSATTLGINRATKSLEVHTSGRFSYGRWATYPSSTPYNYLGQEIPQDTSCIFQ